MFHLDNSSGVDTMPTVANKQSDTTKWFTEGDNVNPPSYPGQDWFNIMQAECLNILKVANITPKKTQLNQLSTAIQQIVNNAKASSATTTAAGIVQLSSAVNSEAENQAATPKAVKTAYDLADAAFPKAGGTLSGDLNIKKQTAKVSVTDPRNNNTGEFVANHEGMVLRGSEPDILSILTRLRYTTSTRTWNFENSAVTINGAAALKAGDGGLYGKSPLLTAGTDFSSDLVTNNNQIFTLSGRYVGTPDDTASWGGVLEVKRRLYDASTACILTIKFNNRTYEKEGNKSSGNWVWGSWKEIITTANVESYVGKSYVTETYQSSDGTSWYRKWSDGFIEQGGVTDNLTINETVVNLLTPMSTANYIVNLQVITESTANEFFNPVFNRTTSSFSTRLRGYNGSQISNVKNTWLVTGY